MKSNELELRFVFTDFPGPKNECVFVEVENDMGESVNTGEWRKRSDGLVELVVLRHPAPTIVDLANADADGYRNGRASVVVELPAIDDPDCGARVSFHLGAYRAQCRQAIIAAGGSVKE